MTLNQFINIPVCDCYIRIVFHDIVVADEDMNCNEDFFDTYVIPTYGGLTVKRVICIPNDTQMPILEIELE